MGQKTLTDEEFAALDTKEASKKDSNKPLSDDEFNALPDKQLGIPQNGTPSIGRGDALGSLAKAYGLSTLVTASSPLVAGTLEAPGFILNKLPGPLSHKVLELAGAGAIGRKIFSLTGGH